MAAQDRDAWLVLALADLPPLRCASLLEAFGGSPLAVLAAPPAALASCGLTVAERERLEKARQANIAAVCARTQEMGVSLVTLHDMEYPCNLRTIPDPPPALFVRGRLDDVDARAVAIVGTRGASPYGVQAAKSLAADLARNGATVVSGLARGIDTAAHEGALEAGGRTIGVMACGIDFPYPRDSQDLMRRIADTQSGAVVSELPPGTPPSKTRFPHRNRVISGLSLGVVVVEAPERSGALITARLAAEQGREVFAMPGSINSVLSVGSHNLIKDGAKLVQTVSDVLEELNLPVVESEPQPLPELSVEEGKLLSLLSLEQRNIEELIQDTSLPSSELYSALLLLELKGLVRRLPGNSFMRVR
jgi:DNA processing protein